MQNLVTLSHIVYAYVVGPKIWGTLGPRLLAYGRG